MNGRAFGALAAVLPILLALGAAPAARAQTDPATEARAALAADPSPATVDRLLAAMTDAELRAFLADELRAQAAAAAARTSPETWVAMAGTRAETLGRLALARLGQWLDAVATLPDRASEVRARLALGSAGAGGMLAAFATLAALGLGAAFAAERALGAARRFAAAADGASYGGRLLRSALLLALELLPVCAFVGATIAAAPLLRAPLGALWDYVWIWHAGVSGGWALVVAARRLFAPDAPQIRIAALDDATAADLLRLVRRAVSLAVGGWLVAGLFPTLGGGIGPAILVVLATGTAVAALAAAATLRRRRVIEAAALGVLGATGAGPNATARLLAAAAPWALAAYVGVAWLYWAAHWLESGAQRLAGPIGLVLALFAAPALDRLGAALVAEIAGRRATGARLRPVLEGAWRVGLALGAAVLVARLWGLDLPALLWGPGAPAGLRAVANVAVSVLLAAFGWRLIVAALPDAARTEGAAEGDEGGAPVGGASRQGTLTPILRSFLKVLLVTTALMAALSSVGLDIAPLLASAGVIGIAIGFGAQSLVRDVFAGLFFLIDDAFRVGEYIELDENRRGTVDAISIRSLQLRHHLGAIITIPFGEIPAVENHSRDWVIYKLAFRMEPETDPQKVKKIVKTLGAELLADPEHGPKFLEPLKSQGVYMIDDDSALVIRVKFKCRPGAQFVLRREVYHRLTRAFAAEGCRLARRKVEVVGAAAGAAAAA